jgi:DNA-binding transcriptional regulator PaaX
MNGTGTNIKEVGDACDAQKRAKRDRTIRILKMVALGVLIIGIGAAPSPSAISRMLHELTLRDTAENRRYAKRKVKQLKQHGFLQKRGVRYAVSDKGSRLLSGEDIWNLQIPRPRAWDGRWHLIMFDIPQVESTARKALNSALLRMGLVQYQQSVLIYPYPIKETLLKVCRFYRVTRYVSFVSASDVDGAKELKRIFKLR